MKNVLIEYNKLKTLHKKKIKRVIAILSFDTIMKPPYQITSEILKLIATILVCPMTTKTNRKAKILRVHIPKGVAGSRHNCDIMIVQLRAIDNRRLIHKIGSLPNELKNRVKANIKTVLDLDE